MNNNKDDLAKASRLIQAVLDSSLTSEAALASWPVTSKGSDKMLKSAYHLLHHYFADEDIRGRDLKYSASQRGALEKCAEDLLARSQKQT